MSDPTPEFERAIEHLKTELAGIRTGRANPALVESIGVEAYESSMPLVQLAGITTPDAKTIVVQPWDKTLLKNIERALQLADLGISPVNDGTVIRLSMPPLTEERRREFLKILHGKLEQARVAIRKIREDALKTLKQSKEQGTISEDVFFAEQKNLQKTVDDFIARIEAMGQQKETELMTV